jgi:hypothetical protein
MVEPPGRFKGKAAIRKLLEWDVQLSPIARSQPTGVNLLVKDNIAIEEEVLEQSYEGIPYQYPLVRIFEVDENGDIKRLRVYLDRLGFMPDRLPNQRSQRMGVQEPDDFRHRTGRERAEARRIS